MSIKTHLVESCVEYGGECSCGESGDQYVPYDAGHCYRGPMLDMSFNVENAGHRFSADLAEKFGCFLSVRPVF